MRQRTKKILAALILLVLCLPMLQDRLHIFRERPLVGSISKTFPEPQFNVVKWLGGKWQDSAVIYYNDRFGLRNWFVCLNNQLYYSLFKRARANAVIAGKDDYLYDITHIRAYTGEDGLGYRRNSEWLQKFYFVQQALEKKGVTLLLVTMPGKASYYPEYLPDRYAAIPRRTTNIQQLQHIADSLGVNCINLSPWLLGLKTKSPYPMYSPYGIHWNEYGMLTGMDSVGRYLEKKRHIDLPDVQLHSMHWTDSLHAVDRDIADGTNLLFSFPKVKLAYPVYDMQTEGKTQLDALCIGDSYYWQFFASSKIERAWFRSSQFWFYFRELHTRDSPDVQTDREKINLRSTVLSKQVILVFYTESNLVTHGNGFIDELYDMIKNTGRYAALLPQHKDEIRQNILKDENWKAMILKKAEDNKVPFDTMLKRDVNYVVEHEWD